MKASLLLALALGAASLPALAQSPQAPNPATAAPAANRFAATIKPAEQFESGTLLVERHGARGRPLILIPGLASGPWVWQETIRQFKDDYTVYVVTLPGFDGRPAPAGAPFEGARAALRELIAARKLKQPVLIGHSLGGTLALAVAQDLGVDGGNQIGGVVAIDGLPVFPGTENMPPEQRPQAAAGVRARLAASPPQAYAEQQRAYLRGQGVLDMGKADDLLPLTLRSDREAVGAYVADLLALDLRPGLGKISAPVLVMAPYYEYDAVQDTLTVAAKVDHYRSLLEGASRVDVTPIAPARHFVMIDQPQAVTDALRRFLNRR